MTALLVVSFVAGVLTVLAPCILPLLPVIIGGTAAERDSRKPFIITGSLIAAIFVFTLLLKAGTALLDVPLMVWQSISGGLLILFGVISLFPQLWEKAGARLNIRSNRLLASASRKKGIGRDILMGAALGPVFSSCSPTYALIVASILPASPGTGLLYLLAYCVGLGAVLLLIAIAGQRLSSKLGWASNPNGWLKRILGIMFIGVGVSVLFGLDKILQTAILDSGLYDPIEKLEQYFLR